MSEMSKKRLPDTADTIGQATHEQLWQICKKLPSDFQPFGKRERNTADCSCGCKFFHVLDGPRGADWGVCWNPKSPRAGMLTFEHMGCPKYTYDKRWDRV
jgi:hypothetical protein